MSENLKVNSKTSTLEWKRKYNNLVKNASILKPNEFRFIISVNRFSVSGQEKTYFFGSMTLFLKEYQEGMSVQDFENFYGLQLLSLAMQNTGQLFYQIIAEDDNVNTSIVFKQIRGYKDDNIDVVEIDNEIFTEEDLNECLYEILDLKTGEVVEYEI